MLTARQRLGLAVSKLTQEELDAAVHTLAIQAASGDARAIHALARVLDQAFGRAKEEVAPDGRDADQKQWDEMTPAERAAYRVELLRQVREQRTSSMDSTDPRTTAQHAQSTQGTATTHSPRPDIDPETGYGKIEAV